MKGEIYIVKVFEVEYLGGRKHRYYQETVAVTSNYQRAKDILENNICGIDDGEYEYGLLVTVGDGKVYSEINPLNLEVFHYNVELDKFEPCDDEEIIEGIEYIYSYIK